MTLTYKDAGVNVAAGNKAVQQMKQHVQSTFIPGVIGNIGGFGALFQPDLTGMKEPVIVSSTDGVGTKLKLAITANIHDTVGIDLVAMSVNDLICTGAKPLFFLDYIACHTLVPNDIANLVKGIADGCKQAGCALIGGETAELGDMYQPKEYDLAGFAVGIVDKSRIIDGSRIQNGDWVLGIESSGIHSNGYSLARKVLDMATVNDKNKILLDMLTPTRIYVADIASLVSTHPIHGIAHITGGGFPEKLGRIIPSHLTAHIDSTAWTIPAIFKWIQIQGNITLAEMFHTFNMGMGMAIVVSPNVAKAILRANATYRKIGDIEMGSGGAVID